MYFGNDHKMVNKLFNNKKTIIMKKKIRAYGLCWFYKIFTIFLICMKIDMFEML